MSSIHPSVSFDFYRILTLIRVGFQVYDGQSSFIDNLFTSNYSNYSMFHILGMPLDNTRTDLGAYYGR
jgi:hypothetical protein